MRCVLPCLRRIFDTWPSTVLKKTFPGDDIPLVNQVVDINGETWKNWEPSKSGTIRRCWTPDCDMNCRRTARARCATICLLANWSDCFP